MKKWFFINKGALYFILFHILHHEYKPRHKHIHINLVIPTELSLSLSLSGLWFTLVPAKKSSLQTKFSPVSSLQWSHMYRKIQGKTLIIFLHAFSLHKT